MDNFWHNLGFVLIIITFLANLPLADPLNVIPDDYEYSNYVDDEYDPNDIPADQAAPLPGYGGDDLGQYKLL